MNDGKRRRTISTTHGMTVLLTVAAALVLGSWAFATTPGGGNDAATDCFIEFDGVSTNPVVCTDGDSTCDSDGTADGKCTFHIRLCPNQTDLAGCTPAPPLKSVKVKPKKTGPPAGRTIV